MRLRAHAVLERAIDVAVLGGLVFAAIQTESELTRIVVLAAAMLLVFGWIVAWRRR